ncbi:hypothetical protein FHS72_000333 [Loktanella ponticola]|uniref:Uncharacterized protein n=1 Tax=Yoonia ponticola TaxID=1524255 RepID=A0A7W9EWL1_9RHOB|nr:hypothetical protein [Yoonia ponticola]MBB5720729.1 hypothetical protein [Yoonia ponticola]
MAERWLRLNETEDVFISLEEVARQIVRTNENFDAWKWGTIALISATSSALVANLSGTTNVGALEKQNAKDALAALQHDSQHVMTDPFLADPLGMLKLAQRPKENRKERAGSPIQVDDEWVGSFKTLVRFRNGFMHFKPMSWSIEVSDFPTHFLNVLGIVEATFGDGWSYRHMKPRRYEELLKLSCDLRNKLVHLYEIT